MSTDTHLFQAEVRQLLDIVIHALYSDREIFIRELVSNASDASEKLRMKQLSGEAIFQPERPLRIAISTDEEAKTITISDAGIGMTEAEVVENLGTIAHSGTKKFLEAMKSSQGKTDLIGQFGVGFYSSFMVADKVEVITRSWEQDAKAIHWESDGREGYKISPADSDTPRGTSIIIHLNEEGKAFASDNRIRGILHRYSNFVSFPIDLGEEHFNTVQAIWTKSKSEVTAEEYDEFFQFIAHTDSKPMTHMHFSADAPIALNALLFAPSENPENYGFGRTESNVSLYCHRVLIDAKPDGLLPEWLRFLSGVVDSEDLPLNISREMLQDHSLVRKINDILTKRFLKHLDKMQKDSPEDYAAFYKQFSRFLKEGTVTAWPYKEQLGNLLRFESTFTKAGEYTSFADYISRMKEGQKDIYVLAGSSRANIENSPYLEAFNARGYEVIFMTENGDQFVIESLSTMDGKAIRPIDRADIELEPLETEGEALNAEDSDALREWMESLFIGKFEKITLGNRLVKGSAVALQGAHDMGPEVRAYMKAMGQDIEEQHPQLELNPHNPLIRKLSDLRTKDEPLAQLVAEQIANTALLRAGLLDDYSALADASQELMERLLEK